MAVGQRVVHNQNDAKVGGQYLPQTPGQSCKLLLQLSVLNYVEDILDGVDIAPGTAAAADHLSQISWRHKIPLQQVEADSSTEPLQASEGCDSW